MPKSSNAVATPRSFNDFTALLTALEYSINAPSVNSNSMVRESIPAVSMAFDTRPTRLPSRNCTPDTLTATRQRQAPASRHRRAWAQASRSTQSPISTIRPLFSASGMNSSGGTKPRVGCDQRSSASTASTRRSLSARRGW